ncbi:hypothetical protein ACRYCC_27750 [Actinomadura scrupuli]|uniref:hypothetical protein n=1 Tax=Actinomadura scrupuli TaxID=559629 RepID=UPI003D997B9B
MAGGSTDVQGPAGARGIAGSVLAAGLIAAALTPGSPASAQTGVAQVAARPKPGPGGGQYFDSAQWQREARDEMLRSMRTGEPFDWAKVYRRSLHPLARPRTTARRQHVNSHPAHAGRHGAAHHLRRPLHRPVPLGRPSRPAAPVTVSATPTVRTPHPPSKAPLAAASATRPAGRTPAAAGRHRVASSPRVTASPSPGRNWWNVPLLILMLGSLLLAVAARRRLTPVAAVIRSAPKLSGLRVVRPRRAPAPPEAVPLPGLDPFAVGGLALTGAGAAPAARGVIMAVLTGRPSGSAEVVMSRVAAWNLLGIGAGDLAGDQLPGLVLTGDFLQAKAHLQTPGPARLFVTCSGGLDLLHDLLTRERGRIAAISLTPWPHATIEVTADGRISGMSHPHLAGALTSPLPTLTRAQAHTRLMTLPTVRRPEPPEARRDPPGSDHG